MTSGLKSIKQVVFFKSASPEQVYDLLLDSKKHASFTGARASVSKKFLGKSIAYDGGLQWINLELVPAKKIVWKWRCEMPEWPKGFFSKATFLFTAFKG